MTRRVALLAVCVCLAVGTRSATASAQAAPPAPETIAVGDWQLAPVAEVRVRGEYRYDLDALNQGTLLERARLGVDVVRGPIEARVVMQDARTLDVGGGPQPVVGPAPVAATGAYEAWVEAHTGVRDATYLRVGRQPVRWGEGRLLGTADWWATGRSLDAIRGRLSLGDVSFELLGAFLMDPDTPASLDSYGELVGGRMEWAFDPLLALDVYVLARIAQESPAADLGGSVRGETYTGALRLHGDAHSWDWGAEGAYELGHAADLRLDRRAFAAAAHVSRELDRVAWRPVLRLGAAYASGDERKATFGTFDPLLPDVHVWHGAMDLFSWSNEAEVSAGAAVAPWTDGSVSVEYRYARLAQPGAAWTSGNLVTIGSAGEGNTKADLGHEVDAVLHWAPWVPVDLAAGYSFFVLGGGADAVLAASGVGAPQAGGGPRVPSVSHFVYAQVTVVLP